MDLGGFINIARTVRRPFAQGKLWPMILAQISFFKSRKITLENRLTLMIDLDVSRNAFMDPAVSRYYYLTAKIMTLGGLAICLRESLPLHVILLNKYCRFLIQDRVAGKSIYVSQGSFFGLLDDKSGVARIQGPFFDGAKQEKYLRLDGSHKNSRELLFPLPMHPSQYFNKADSEMTEVFNQHASKKRSMGILFSGGRGLAYVKKTGYQGKEFHPREVILQKLEAHLAKDGASVGGLPVVVESKKIPPELWMQHLAEANFFLALPGVKNPFCHNLAEALAVGTVPICNYGHLLDPPLSDLSNCISFSEDDIESALHKINSLLPQDVEKMRKCAKEYYDVNLSPSSFAKKINQAVVDKQEVIIRFPYGNR